MREVKPRSTQERGRRRLPAATAQRSLGVSWVGPGADLKRAWDYENKVGRWNTKFEKLMRLLGGERLELREAVLPRLALPLNYVTVRLARTGALAFERNEVQWHHDDTGLRPGSRSASLGHPRLGNGFELVDVSVDPYQRTAQTAALRETREGDVKKRVSYVVTPLNEAGETARVGNTRAEVFVAKESTDERNPDRVQQSSLSFEGTLGDRPGDGVTMTYEVTDHYGDRFSPEYRGADWIKFSFDREGYLTRVKACSDTTEEHPYFNTSGLKRAVKKGSGEEVELPIGSAAVAMLAARYLGSDVPRGGVDTSAKLQDCLINAA